MGEIPVLYTSLEREGALAEIVFHWSQLFPLPSKPIEIHRISLTAQRTLRLLETDLESLGVDSAEYSSLNYQRTQLIGAEVSFLGFDGLLVTSARWNCENLVLFMDNHHLENDLRLLESEEVDWKPWAIQHGFLDPEKS